ncbi:metal ABC transporter ATP-binding protein [Streptococcaceae bacterium ESL0687]|nr:metal ABC transporter ATP-binding protein [Streptococcaceae bacterium ESL0687]
MFKVKGLGVAYGGKEALKDINFEIDALGTSIGIIGPNGAGKSTFLKALLGLVKKTGGSSYFNDRDILSLKRNIAYVPQRSEIDLSFPITVFEVILTGTYPKLPLFKRPGVWEKGLALKSLEEVGLVDYKDAPLSSLSGGQLQRVFIARALAQEADYYFLDEPFVGIDMVSEKIIIDIISDLKAKGKTILTVHHDLNKVEDYFDNLIIINQELVGAGPVSEIFTRDMIGQAYGQVLLNLDLKGVKD